jgi:glyoxylase-like metal-dependent hydrolase (beta-lactamase superfamily II)
VANHIYLIPGGNNGRFPYSHSVLIVDDKIVLIDTGCGINTLQQLRKEYDIDYVINSHTHIDHISGNWVFQDKPLFVPEEGSAFRGSLVKLSQRFVSDELAPLWRQFAREVLKVQDREPTDSYNEQTTFRFGTVTLKPIHTPGHTIDHYCFLEERERILFSFDYDLTSFPWYGHRESDLADFRTSVKKLKALSPEIVVSSHKGIITEDIPGRFDAFYQQLDKRNERILALLGDGKTVTELVDHAPIYGKFPYVESLLRYWEASMIEKHLEELERDGRVQKHGDHYRRS